MPNIVKKLFIKDKEQLYKLVEPNDDLKSNSLFTTFLDSMNDYYYGCKCSESYFDSVSNQEYKNIKNDEVANLLKDYFNCDSVEFI
jgi:hypothetical protein